MLCTFACKTLKGVLSNPVQAALTCDYTQWLINQMAPECFCSLSKPQHVERKDISKCIHMRCTHLCHTYTVMYVLHMKIRIVYSHKYKHRIDGLTTTVVTVSENNNKPSQSAQDVHLELENAEDEGEIRIQCSLYTDDIKHQHGSLLKLTYLFTHILHIIQRFKHT